MKRNNWIFIVVLLVAVFYFLPRYFALKSELLNECCEKNNSVDLTIEVHKVNMSVYDVSFTISSDKISMGNKSLKERHIIVENLDGNIAMEDDNMVLTGKTEGVFQNGIPVGLNNMKRITVEDGIVLAEEMEIPYFQAETENGMAEIFGFKGEFAYSSVSEKIHLKGKACSVKV